MPTHSSATQQLAAIHLGKHPGEWINEKRCTVPETPWRVIAYEMAAACNGELIVSEPTIRKWNRQWVAEQLVERHETEVGAA